MKSFNGLKKIGSLIDGLTRPAFAKYGFANQKIITFWPQIVGKELAAFTLPQKIIFPPAQTRGGVLYIGVKNPGLCLEIQAQESRIVGKIAVFFGYQAVSRIKVMPVRFDNKQQTINPAPKQEITHDEKLALEDSIANIKDSGLQERFKGLAESLFKEKE